MYSHCLSIWFVFSAILFIAVSAVHLRRCFQGKEGLADITKFALMPALLLSFLVCVFVGNLSFSAMNILVVVALMFSFLGDWSLIFDGEKRFFFFGMLFFAVTHICYIAIAILKFQTIEFPSFTAGLIFLLSIFIIVYIFLLFRKQLKEMKKAFVIYSLLLAVMGTAFISLAIASPGVPAILIAIGGIIFIVSDYMVGYRHFLGGIIKSRFFIMLTYIVAQFLIVLGLLGA